MSNVPTLTPLASTPFSDSYWKAEIKAYGLRKGKGHKGEAMHVDWLNIEGRCNDYLNVNFRYDKTKFPRLLMGTNGDQQVWMSLTPMEIQSSALAIHRAHGVVVVGGLGLGYVAIRMAAKPQVSKVIVYEISQENADWFARTFAHRPEMAKIEVRVGDMRTLFRKVECDYCYVDIYPDMGADETITDMKLFLRRNKIKRYNFWGWERILVNLLCYPRMNRFRDRLFRYGGPAMYLGKDFRSFLGFWMEYEPFQERRATDCASDALDQEYVEKSVNLMTQFYPL